MAGAGWRDFTTGEVVTEPYVQTYLQDQSVMVFASASARTTALSGVVAEGMVSYLSDTNLLYVYDGAAWVQIPATVNVRKNSAGSVYTQPRINFIEGTNITLTVADDGSEVDVTITSATQTGIVQNIVKSADETVSSSTTLQNDDALVLALTANTNYSFQCWLYVTDASVNVSDIKAAFTVPSGASLAWSGSALSPSGGAVSASGTTFPVVASGTAAVWIDSDVFLILISGSVRNGANAGNLQLQWAQSTSSATNTVVKAGSWLTTAETG